MSCPHLTSHHSPADDPAPQTTKGCQDCLAMGAHDWVHLRLCLGCGHIGCCDSSPRRHASAHFRSTLDTGAAHPLMRSFEPGESWRWCFIDETVG
jgi:hypothetical protein